MLRKVPMVAGMFLALTVAMVESPAWAGLTMDLRLDGGSTSAVIHRYSSGGSYYMYNNDGSANTNLNVTLYVWAKVTGTHTSGADDSFSSANFSVYSGGSTTGNNLTGNLTSSTPQSGWNNGSSNGRLWDLNGDGIKDMGSSATSSTVDFMKVRSSGSGNPPRTPGGTTVPGMSDAITNGWEWNVDAVTFHVDSVVVGTGKTTFKVVRPSWYNGPTKAAGMFLDSSGTSVAIPFDVGTSVSFTLAPTAVTASLTNQGTDGKYHVSQGGSVTLGGMATITDGFGSVSQYGWDLNNDGTADVTSTDSSKSVTYDYLTRAVGLGGLGLAQGDHSVTLIVTSNDGASGSSAPGTLNIVPEPATVALLVTGGIAIAARRRRHKDA